MQLVSVGSSSILYSAYIVYRFRKIHVHVSWIEGALPTIIIRYNCIQSQGLHGDWSLLNCMHTNFVLCEGPLLFESIQQVHVSLFA